MKKYSLNHDWQFTEGELRNPLMMNLLGGWRKCSLPHDCQILKPRDPRSAAADNEGWTQGAAVFYKKEFVVEPETAGKRCWLEFEGIAGVCEVWVNGIYLAKHRNPYTGLIAEVTKLVHPGENVVQVHVDSRMKPNSRWYVGTGLYRRVWLHLAELRRVRILQENGFNALRGAHNPFGPAFYEACDELGMLVIEEAFDEWVLGRTDFGLHITFEESWERDLEDMIRRDYNHPSIVMWSTGNEVEERDGSADGYAWSRRLADKGVTGNQALNMAYDAFAEGRDLWGPATAEYFAPLDVAGYNYKTARYEYDHEKFPDRVICGSESYPRAALQSWQATQRNAHVIGDFVWTAWEYIGEVGGGRWEVTDEERPGDAKYPWLLAYQGDIDLLGNKRPQSYYRDFVWKRGNSPKLFCLPPELVGKHIARLSWGWLPVRRSYTFPGWEGQNVEIHVYAGADEVELLQNGVSMGRLPCTEAQEYTAVFTVPYVPGRLEAVAYTGGVETGRDKLQTAGETAALAMTADRPAIAGDGDELAFVTIRALDTDGVHVFDEAGEVTVKVTGGELLALGAADPKPDRTLLFAGESCPMFEGTAMAVIRGERGAKGCMVEASLGGITARLPIGFTAGEEFAGPVHDVKPGPLDLPLGELVEDPATLAVLKTYLGNMVDSPMVGAMKGMSLKKIFAMGGQSAPEGLEDGLARAKNGGTDHV